MYNKKKTTETGTVDCDSSLLGCELVLGNKRGGGKKFLKLNETDASTQLCNSTF